MPTETAYLCGVPLLRLLPSVASLWVRSTRCESSRATGASLISQSALRRYAADWEHSNLLHKRLSTRQWQSVVYRQFLLRKFRHDHKTTSDNKQRCIRQDKWLQVATVATSAIIDMSLQLIISVLSQCIHFITNLLISLTANTNLQFMIEFV